MKVVLSEKKFCELFFLRELRAVEGEQFSMRVATSRLLRVYFCSVATCSYVTETKTEVYIHVCVCVCVCVCITIY